MDELHRVADKLTKEVTHLSNLLADDMGAPHAELALAVAKRVRRDSTLVVRLLAAYRDELQP